MPDELENRNGDFSLIQYPSPTCLNNFSRDFFNGREIVIKAPRRVVDRRVPRLPRKGWRHRIHTTDAPRARSPCRARAVARGTSRSAARIAKGSQVWGLGALRKPTTLQLSAPAARFGRGFGPTFAEPKTLTPRKLVCFAFLLPSFKKKEKREYLEQWPISKEKTNGDQTHQRQAYFLAGR